MERIEYQRDRHAGDLVRIVGQRRQAAAEGAARSDHVIDIRGAHLLCGQEPFDQAFTRACPLGIADVQRFEHDAVLQRGRPDGRGDRRRTRARRDQVRDAMAAQVRPQVRADLARRRCVLRHAVQRIRDARSLMGAEVQDARDDEPAC